MHAAFLTHANHATHGKILWTHAKSSTHVTHAKIWWTHATHTTHSTHAIWQTLIFKPVSGFFLKEIDLEIFKFQWF